MVEQKSWQDITSDLLQNSLHGGQGVGGGAVSPPIKSILIVEDACSQIDSEMTGRREPILKQRPRRRAEISKFIKNKAHDDPYEELTVLELRHLKEHFACFSMEPEGVCEAKIARIDAILEARRPPVPQTFDTKREYEERIQWLEDQLFRLYIGPPDGCRWAPSTSPYASTSYCEVLLQSLMTELEYYFPDY